MSTEMSEADVLKTLQFAGAVITESHIVYTSGKHGSEYVNKDAVYPHTFIIQRLCYQMANKASDWCRNIEVVIAPAIGGVILSTRIAEHLCTLWAREVPSVYAEKEGDQFVIKRGYDKFIRGKRVLVVEDILNTGGSVEKVINTVRSIDGDVVGVAALCNRGGVTPEKIGNPPFLVSLCNLQMEAWDEGACPLCKQGIPINTEIGKGREFLARQTSGQ